MKATARSHRPSVLRHRRPRRCHRLGAGDRRSRRAGLRRPEGICCRRKNARALAALYPDDKNFRSRIVMGRHGFGRGEYKYFSYPLPDLIAELRPALYAQLCGVANRWNETMGIDIRYPDRHEAFLKRCHDAGQTSADAAAAAIWRRRLQLPASGSLWRARVSAAGRDPAVGTGARFHRRRVRADRAAAADAVAARSGSAQAGRCGRLCCASPAGAGDARASIALICAMASAGSVPATATPSA